ncbi:MAG TPA: hypothetical protein PKD53_31615 [Chloroflexaceae bacterium]|nr:hypothetical protein [Chloroflexaceae bacterium]
MHKDDEQRRPDERDEARGERTTGAMSPGDEAPAGTPGTGENVCPVCGGEGTVDGGECANCGGTGVVIEGIGGA